MNIDAWQASLPPIAFRWIDPDTVPNRMWGATQAFDAVAAAQEMEAEREFARRETDVSREKSPDAKPSRIALQWWRVHVGLKYEAAGALTLKMAEWRVMRALALSEPFRGYGSRNPKVSRVLAELALSQADIRDRAKNMPPEGDLGVPLDPLPQDHADFLVAMSWFIGLNPPTDSIDEPWAMSPEQEVLARRALPMPWSYEEIADKLKPRVKRERARQIYSEAIEAVWRIGAGLDQSPATDRIQDLRERNRRFKRNQAGAIL